MLDRVTFVDQTFNAKKDVRFRLINRPHLWDIYRELPPYLFLLGGRQIEKTSNIIVLCLTDNIEIPGFTNLYTMPQEEQAHQVSKTQFSDIANNTPYVLRSMYKITSVTEKRFKNQSKMIFGYAKDTADRLRGRTCDRLILDEVQDMHMDIFPIIRETYTHSRFGYEITSGTAKLETSPTAFIWKMSTGYDWWVRCPHCGKLQFLTPKNIGLLGAICNKKGCGSSLKKENILDYPKNANWVATQKPESSTKGYRINQLMSPDILDNWPKFLRKIEMIQGDQEQIINNEIFGFHYGKGDRAFTEEELKTLCAWLDMGKWKKMALNKSTVERYTFMGVDWGGKMLDGFGKSETAITILGFPFAPGQMAVMYSEIFSGIANQDLILNEIRKLVDRFKVVKIGVDMGMGVDKVPRMITMFPGKVFPFYYSDGYKGFIGYHHEGYFVANRTRAISLFIEDIKAARIKLPPWEHFSKVAADYLSIYRTGRRTPGRETVYYDRDADKTDDAFHSAIFARLAYNVHSGNFMDLDTKVRLDLPGTKPF